jgi:hypothetical protein
MARPPEALLEDLRCRACGDIQWSWQDAAVIGDLDRTRPRVGLIRGDGERSGEGHWSCACGGRPAGRRQRAALRSLMEGPGHGRPA